MIFESKQVQFLEAILNGNSSEVKRLISHPKVDVNAENDRDGTPLHEAARDGHLEICELLIKKRADISMQRMKMERHR